jgi:hypothetical protein
VQVWFYREGTAAWMWRFEIDGEWRKLKLNYGHLRYSFAETERENKL